MQKNGFVWAFDEQNSKYKSIKNKRKKEEKKENEKLIKCIFRDNGKLITVTIQQENLGIERLKHNELITTYNA